LLKIFDDLFHLDTSENISGEKKMNGHETSPRDKLDNKSDESEDENPVIQPGNGHEQEEKINLTNGKNDTEQDANEQAATPISDDTDKTAAAAAAATNESDATSRRRFEYFI
jgi:hypothetical protein